MSLVRSMIATSLATALGACAASGSSAGASVAVSSAAVEPAEEASSALLRACEAAPLLGERQAAARVTLTKTSPRFVVRVEVPGDGELGLGGASRSVPVRTVDMKSKKTASAGMLGRCFASVPRPSPGEHCIVLHYDGDEHDRPLTFDFDYASGMHDGTCAER